jgi:hypothetical protein
MPSSSRIIRPASSTATAERGRANHPDGASDSIDGGDPARDAPVLRGNPNARRAGVNALSGDAGSGADRGRPRPVGENDRLAATVAWALAPREWPRSGPSGGPGGPVEPGVDPAPADHPPIDLLQAQRIADQRGYATGHARSTTELEAAIAAVGALAERLEAVAPTRTTAVARSIADIAVALARRIIGAGLRHDPALLVHSIETAVTMINGSPEARVILHPSAVEPIRAAWESAHGSTHLGKRWTFEADDSFAPGACILRFDHGFVDAGIEAQLVEIERAIDAAIPGLWSGVPTNGDTLAVETAP